MGILKIVKKEQNKLKDKTNEVISKFKNKWTEYTYTDAANFNTWHRTTLT